MFDIVCSLSWISRDKCCDLPATVRTSVVNKPVVGYSATFASHVLAEAFNLCCNTSPEVHCDCIHYPGLQPKVYVCWYVVIKQNATVLFEKKAPQLASVDPV